MRGIFGAVSLLSADAYRARREEIDLARANLCAL